MKGKLRVFLVALGLFALLGMDALAAPTEVNISTKEELKTFLNKEGSISAQPFKAYLQDGVIANIKSDISLSSADIGGEYQRIFSKVTINGNGHTITIDGNMTRPLFHSISTSSTFKDLNLVYNNNVVGAGLASKVFNSVLSAPHNLFQNLSIHIKGDVLPLPESGDAYAVGVVDSASFADFKGVNVTVDGSIGNLTKYKNNRVSGFMGYTSDGSPGYTPNVAIDGVKVVVGQMKGAYTDKLNMTGIAMDVLYGTINDASVHIKGDMYGESKRTAYSANAESNTLGFTSTAVGLTNSKFKIDGEMVLVDTNRF